MKRSIFVLAAAMVLSLSVSAKQIAKDEQSFRNAAEEACAGHAIGARCTVTFQGGSVGIGVCVEVPGPVTGVLTCQINTSQIPNCKNNALATPSSWMTFGGLAGLLLLMRRRRSVK